MDLKIEKQVNRILEEKLKLAEKKLKDIEEQKEAEKLEEKDNGYEIYEYPDGSCSIVRNKY